MLHKQIRLEKWVSTKDGSGDFKETTTKYNLWAEVFEDGGGRSQVNGKNHLTNTARFRVYFRPDLKPTVGWKVVYDQKRYTISNIKKENGERFYWIITATSND